MNVKNKLLDKLNSSKEKFTKQKVKFDVDKTTVTKIKRPNIELPFMNDGDFVVNQQEND